MAGHTSAATERSGCSGGVALVISGDQHLATFCRLGVDQPSDAVYELCVPAMGDIFWRWFYPLQPGEPPAGRLADYTGDFVDAFGNYSGCSPWQPERRELMAQKLWRRVDPRGRSQDRPGRFRTGLQSPGLRDCAVQQSRETIKVANWPSQADPTAGGKPWPGWPVTLKLEDLDGRRPVAWLPDLKITGEANPVVQIIDQNSGEMVKITRPRNGAYRPGVFVAKAMYTLRVGEPGTKHDWWVKRDLQPSAPPGPVRWRSSCPEHSPYRTARGRILTLGKSGPPGAIHGAEDECV